MEKNRLFSDVFEVLHKAVSRTTMTQEILADAAESICSKLETCVKDFVRNEIPPAVRLTKFAYSKRFKNVLVGRQKSRLALKLAIDDAFASSSREERRLIWGDYTRKARGMVDESINRAHEKKYQYHLQCIEQWYGEC